MSSASRAHSMSAVEIDARRDPHLVAHEHQVLGADIAGGALVAAKGQPPSPATELSKIDARPSRARHRRWRSPMPRVSCRCSDSVSLGDSRPHLADQSPDRHRRRPGHRVGERSHLRLHAMLGRDVEQLAASGRARARCGISPSKLQPNAAMMLARFSGMSCCLVHLDRSSCAGWMLSSIERCWLRAGTSATRSARTSLRCRAGWSRSRAATPSC